MDEKRTERFTMMLSPAEVKRLEDWAHEHRIRSLSEAARRLIVLGIAASEKSPA